jgi:hypothetical protein
MNMNKYFFHIRTLKSNNLKTDIGLFFYAKKSTHGSIQSFLRKNYLIHFLFCKKLISFHYISISFKLTYKAIRF